MGDDSHLTPAMRQFAEVKKEYPDCIVLFRMGDFYECFYDDAKKVSKLLDVALTARGKGESRAPLAGIPYHALDKYLHKLVQSGEKIAICEQIEDPKTAKGIVKRAVTRVITPGTVVESSILDDSSNNYIGAIFHDGIYGLAVCDISTGEFIVCELEKKADLVAEIARFSLTEVLISAKSTLQLHKDFPKLHIRQINEYYFWYEKAHKVLFEHFAKKIHNLEVAECAAGALLQYIKDTQKISASYIKEMRVYNSQQYVLLDDVTIKNLELLRRISDNSKKGTVLDILDKTKTPMGARQLKQWVTHPLIQKRDIEYRHTCVSQLMMDTVQLEELREILSQMTDITRLLSRMTYGQANAQDVNMLKNTLKLLPILHSLYTEEPLQKLLMIEFDSQITHRIEKTFKEECPVSIRDGGFIREGVNQELDELWALKNNATAVLAKMEQDEIKKTNISSLKIKYNKVFGYFIEITKRFSDSVPSHYMRKQSTVNSERFITDELKELETKIVSADEKIKTLEYNIFMEMTEYILSYTKLLQSISNDIATIDCLQSFAYVSLQQGYRQPRMSDDYDLILIGSRHPVIESFESNFVPNDCHLQEHERTMIITGPNMAGKSTYMRQVALSILFAHIGCFVPAVQTKIPIVDAIFTRVGSHDDLSQGQSTFMVEMTQTARILQKATKRSFVILDEIGSGTSTYDGVAIAWSVAKELNDAIGCKTLFSTHYHVLTQLEKFHGIVNYHATVFEDQNKITFLRKIQRGGTDKSYGIHVAQLAGIPSHVIAEAKKIQIQLESEDTMHKKIVVEKKQIAQKGQLQYNSISKIKQKTLFDSD